jgi:cytochrome P450
MIQFAQEIAERGGLAQGSMPAKFLEAADRGEIAKEQCPVILTGYLAPSPETTISAIANATWLFATNPDQWDLLREDPSHVEVAFNEAVRLESPITSFSRMTTEDAQVADVGIPKLRVREFS